MADQIEVRSPLEIHRAHDLLVGILIGQFKSEVFTPAHMQNLNVAASVLCWVLHHDHNHVFEQALKEIETLMKASGYELKAFPPSTSLSA